MNVEDQVAADLCASPADLAVNMPIGCYHLCSPVHCQHLIFLSPKAGTYVNI